MYGFSSTLSMTVLLYMLSEEPGVRRMPLTLLPRRKEVIFGRAERQPGATRLGSHGVKLGGPPRGRA